jgi:hypothetical protein
MNIEISQEDYEFLKDLQNELNTQENDGNADPVFWGVEETVEECRGGDGEYGGDPYITFDDGKWSLEEAIEVRDQTIETDLADFQGLWVEEDGYSYDTDKMGDDPMSDVYIDVYYNGDIINETIYKIREVEF